MINNVQQKRIQQQNGIAQCDISDDAGKVVKDEKE